MAGIKLAREKKTVAVMIAMYCRNRHSSGRVLCDECMALLDYVKRRLDKCPFGEDKPSCGRCPIHCYRRAQRERIIAVMRHAGPRMIVSHPILTIRHLRDTMSDGRRKSVSS